MDHSKFENITKGLTRKRIIENLADDFEIFDQFLIIRKDSTPISYTSSVELEVLMKQMMDYDIPNHDEWKTVEKFG